MELVLQLDRGLEWDQKVSVSLILILYQDFPIVDRIGLRPYEPLHNTLPNLAVVLNRVQ